MRGYNKIIIVGNLGRDPELSQDGEGNTWATFSVASDDGFGVKWFRISAKGTLAENCAQYLTKGRQVMVEGVLGADKETGSPRVYEKKDHTYGASFDIYAREVLFLSGGEERQREQEQTFAF